MGCQILTPTQPVHKNCQVIENKGGSPSWTHFEPLQSAPVHKSLHTSRDMQGNLKAITTISRTAT